FMAKLRRRGVILIQIDSGTKDIEVGGPSIFTFLAQFVPVFFRPVQALNNTSYTNADLSILAHDRALQSILTPRIASEAVPLARDGSPGPEASPRQSAAAPSEPPPGSPRPGAPHPGPSQSVARDGSPGSGKPSPVAEAHEAPGATPHAGAFPPVYRRIRLTCNNQQNIMTAWTLGPEDKAQVMVQFLIEWSKQRHVLRIASQRVLESSAA